MLLCWDIDKGNRTSDSPTNALKMHSDDERFTWRLSVYELMMCTAQEWVTQHIYLRRWLFPVLWCEGEFLPKAEGCASTSSAICHHALRSPRCISTLIYFPSALKTVQISKNINSTNVCELSAWRFLCDSEGKLRILWACESSHGWKSLKNTRDVCLDVRGHLPIQDCCLVLGWVKF